MGLGEGISAETTATKGRLGIHRRSFVESEVSVSATSANAGHGQVFQSKPVDDKGELMPVAVKFYLFLFVVCVVVFLIAVRLGPLSVVIKVTFKVALAFLAIMIGRWLLGPRNL